MIAMYRTARYRLRAHRFFPFPDLVDIAGTCFLYMIDPTLTEPNEEVFRLRMWCSVKQDRGAGQVLRLAGYNNGVFDDDLLSESHPSEPIPGAQEAQEEAEVPFARFESEEPALPGQRGVWEFREVTPLEDELPPPSSEPDAGSLDEEEVHGGVDGDGDVLMENLGRERSKTADLRRDIYMGSSEVEDAE